MDTDLLVDNSDSNYSEMSFYVKSTECNKYSNLSLPVLLGNLQEIADKGALDTGFDRTIINSHNACWIILRMKVSISRYPVWRESFKLKTWSTGLEKFYFDREFEIYSDDDELIGKASSLWILADLNTHRPVIPSKIPGLPTAYPQGTKLVFGEKLKRNSPVNIDTFSGINPLVTKFGDFSELDHNMHVNNTRYIAWALDCMYKAGYDVKNIFDFSISYISEVKDGEKVDIYLKELPEEKKILISGYKEDGINVFDTEIFL